MNNIRDDDTHRLTVHNNYSKLFFTNRVKILEDLRNCRPGFAFYMFPGDYSSNHPSRLVQVGSYSRSPCFKTTFSNSLIIHKENTKEINV